MFTPIQRILKNHLQKRGIAQQVEASLICQELDQIILRLWGKEGSANAKVLYLKNSVIFIACLTPVMAQEIRLKEDEIITEINKKFGSVVQRLSYQM